MNTEEPDPIPAANPVTTPGEPPSAAIPDEPEFYQPPRLGIIHLLAWTAITAVMFKVDVALRLLEKSSTGDLHSVQVPTVLRAIGFSYVALMAAGIVGLAVLVRAWFRRQRGRLAPGHWILMSVMIPDSAIYLVSVAYYVYYIRLREAGDFLHAYWLLILFTAVTEVVRAVLFILAARRVREKRGWKGSFCLLAIVTVGEAVLYAGSAGLLSAWNSFEVLIMVQWIAAVAQMLTSLVLGIVALIDLLRVRRDWLHCLGMGLYIASNLFSLSYMILPWLIK